MISLLDTIKVPGLPDVEFFRDHQKDHLFHVVRSIPVVARDKNDFPQLSFRMFSRNADIAYASSANKELIEAQLGQLLVTVDLSLSKEEHKIATKYLKKIINKESHPFVRGYYKRYKRKRSSPKIEPILTYPSTWKEGTAKLEILEGLGDTFKKSSSAEVKPSLTASNSASFYAAFGLEGTELMLNALSKGYKTKDGDNEKTPIQAIVRYELKGFGFVPNLEVKVTGQSTQIYNFIQEQTKTYKKEVEQEMRTSIFSKTKKRRILGIPFSSSSLSVKRGMVDTKVDVDKTDINKLIETMIDQKVINVEITDFGDVGYNSSEKKEVEEQLRQMLMELIFGTIIKSFFETAFIGENEDTSEEGKEGDSSSGGGIQPNSNFRLSESDKNVKNQDLYYYFKNEVDKTKISDIHFHFKKNGVVEFLKNPNGTLAVQLTDSERKAAIQYIDVSSPEVQIMEVQVKVNADFEADNIHSVIVNLSYKQKDHKSGIVRQNAKSFLFETGSEIYTFRVSMARNEKRELIDLYTAEAKISYKGTADAPPPIVMKNISDRVLNVSYDKLGFITTQVIAGDMDWNIVKEAVIDLEYLAEPNKPDTRKQIRLNQESVSGNWKCFMYGHKDRRYRYKVKYFYHDGTESETRYKTDTRDSLSIDDNLVGRAKASFDVILDSNTVTTAKVEVLYNDDDNNITEEYSKWFTTTETWDWSMRLREGATDTFKYRYFVQYTDGLVKTSQWEKASSDENIDPIDLKRFKQNLTIDSGMIDWSKWQVVYVNVQYEDSINQYVKQETLRLTKDDFMKSFEIFSFHPKANEFTYNLKFAGNGRVIDIPPKTVKGGILILENPEIESLVEDDITS